MQALLAIVGVLVQAIVAGFVRRVKKPPVAKVIGGGRRLADRVRGNVREWLHKTGRHR